MEVNRAGRRRKTRFCYAAVSAAANISTAWNAYTTCCKVFIRIPLCLNYRVCEMPPVSRCSCGATRVYVALWSFTFQIDHSRERRFASFIFPLYIYKDVKIPGYSHRSILVADFSADLRASVLAMLILEDRPAPGLNDRLPVAKLTTPRGRKPGASPRFKVQIAESPRRRRVLR